MPRRARNTPPGLIYHVLNGGVGRQTLLDWQEDYAAFDRVLAEAPSGYRFASWRLV